MVKARSLQDLAAIKNQLKAKAEKAAALEAAKLEALRRANAEKNLFVRAVGAVTTLDHAQGEFVARTCQTLGPTTTPG